jgi:hypothetical protein
MYAELTSSVNNSAPDTETDGTITPIANKRLKNYSDTNISESSPIISRSKSQMDESNSLTESEYFTAQSRSGFTDSATSSSIYWN